MNITIPDLYTDGKCSIGTPGMDRTVTVMVGRTVFQCTASQWALMCRAFLETQAPGVPGHNTQEENAK